MLPYLKTCRTNSVLHIYIIAYNHRNVKCFVKLFIIYVTCTPLKNTGTSRLNVPIHLIYHIRCPFWDKTPVYEAFTSICHLLFQYRISLVKSLHIFAGDIGVHIGMEHPAQLPVLRLYLLIGVVRIG